MMARQTDNRTKGRSIFDKKRRRDKSKGRKEESLRRFENGKEKNIFRKTELIRKT